MKNYKARKRSKNTAAGLVVFLFVLAVVIGAYFHISKGTEVATLPTDTPIPTSTPQPSATPAPPTATPYPPGSEWDLTKELEDWQIKILINDLNKFWSIFKSPKDGIDCLGAFEFVQKTDPATREELEKICSSFIENGTYEVSLPLENLVLTQTYSIPENGRIGLQFDTQQNWPMKIRYLKDNTVQKILTMKRAIYNVFLENEGGMWKLYSLNIYWEGIDF